METPRLVAFACMFVFTAIALACDLRTLKLPNLLTVPTFCAGLLFHVVSGFWQSGLSGAGHDLLFALGGFGVGFGILLVLWFIGGGGGGDVKFMGALGCWLGAWLTLQVLVVSAVLAGALTMIILLKKVFQMKKLTVQQADARPQRSGKKRAGSAWRVPFGVPAALATWCVLGLDLVGYRLPWPPIH